MKETKPSRYITELPRSKDSKKLKSEVNIELLGGEEVLGMAFPWTYVPILGGLDISLLMVSQEVGVGDR